MFESKAKQSKAKVVAVAECNHAGINVVRISTETQ